MQELEKFHVSDLIVKIYHDPDMPNPRNAFDHLGTLTVIHRDCSIQESSYLEFLTTDVAEFYSLRVHYDGQLTYLANDDDNPHGAIYVTRDKLIQEYGDDSPASREKARRCMEGELQEYNMWAIGAVFGYVIERRTRCPVCADCEKELASCWGFYGMDYCIEEAKARAETCEHCPSCLIKLSVGLEDTTYEENEEAV